MARPCTVCQHEKRREIDLAIVEAEPIRRIAARFGLSETSVRRHADSHLPAGVQRPAGPRPPPEPPHAGELQQAAVRRDADERAHADELVESTMSLEARLLERLDSPMLEADPRGFAAIAREVRGQREFRAKLLGRIAGGKELAPLDDPRFVEYLSAMEKVLGAILPERGCDVFDAWRKAAARGDTSAMADPGEWAAAAMRETEDVHDRH